MRNIKNLALALLLFLITIQSFEIFQSHTPNDACSAPCGDGGSCCFMGYTFGQCCFYGYYCRTPGQVCYDNCCIKWHSEK